MDPKNIRNFSIIAHIDHGKSTLADRMLEITGTVEKRKMKEQVLDQMALERERGITIKMAPVRMDYTLNTDRYILNLIDTPGHIDFAYEVSRALSAVEGAVLLVDSTQGVEAQTLSTLDTARELGLVIVPVINKIDAPLARPDECVEELATLLDVDPGEVLRVSGKTGQGVEELLQAIIHKIPPPTTNSNASSTKALVFDFSYSAHQGVIVYARVFEGTVKRGSKLKFFASDKTFDSLQTGVFAPEMKEIDKLSAGEIGYIVTGIKEPGVAGVGDTIMSASSSESPLAGYNPPQPVVWASVYPESQDDYPLLTQALSRLKLHDSSLTFEGEYSAVLGRGYRCGLLGMLHLEIITERLRREFTLDLIVTTPSVVYEVVKRGGQRDKVYNPTLFPERTDIIEVFEPWIGIRLFSPPEYTGTILKLLNDHEAIVDDMETLNEKRVAVEAQMPLRELMRNFFDSLKSTTAGYASLSYKIMDELRSADVERLDILIADERVDAFSRVVARRRIQEEAQKLVEKLHELMPKQLFAAKIQGVGLGRILSSKTLSAMRKDVTAKLYGGDVTRKMKLLEKQKKGKKKMQAGGKVAVPQDVFLKVMRGG